jgi:general stress protein YciG
VLRCSECGSTRRVEDHHIVYRCDGGSDEQKQPLCHECHVTLHRRNGDYAAWGRGGAEEVMRRRGEEGRAFLREIGRRGGQATAAKDGHLQAIAGLGGRAIVSRHGTPYLRELGRKGGLARWKKE